MRRLYPRILLFLLGLAALRIPGCDNPPPPPTGPGDTVPPAPITDLTVLSTGDSSITLTWTAPGDDRMVGKADHYEFRQSMDPRVVLYWIQATPLDTTIVPREPGLPETLTVEHLAQRTKYYFAVRTLDEAGNRSPVSNVAGSDTGDRTPPAAITDLVVAETFGNAVRLEWTAPGDDGFSGAARAYDIRFGLRISEDTWPGLDRAVFPELPKPGGSRESMLVDGLRSATDFDFAVRAVDDAGNWSRISNVVYAPTRVDTVPPAAIHDLRIVARTGTSITLEWTATGDDGISGKVTEYRVRYSQWPIDPGTWDAAMESSAPTYPKASGGTERAAVHYLSPLTSYHFAIRSMDEAGNLSALSNPVFGETRAAGGQWRVLPDGTGDFPTIQAAIDGASPGDLILVAPGTYTGCIAFGDKDVILRSEAGPEATVLRGCGVAVSPVVHFGAGTTRDAVLEGFTVTGQVGEDAIRVYRGSPTILGNIVRDNTASGLYLYGGDALVRGNVFRNNRDPETWGGGMKVSRGTYNHYDYPVGWGKPIIENNLFEDNDAKFGGAVYAMSTNAVFRMNVFRRNTCTYDGGAFFVWPDVDRVLIEANEFYDNVAGDHGGAVAAWNYQTVGGAGRLDIRGNLMVGNQALGKDSNGNNGIGGAVHVSGIRGSITQNTIVESRGYPLCGGSGITFYLDAEDGPWIVERNILAMNLDGGITCFRGDVSFVQDNLLFGNVHDFGCGGGKCDSSLVNRNLVADPQFCDPGTGDWRVAEGSPALTHPAGPLGCYPTAGCPPPRAGDR